MVTMEAAVKRLHIADYLIFAATIIISLGIGLYHALSKGGQRTTGEYFMGGRGLQTLPVALSILVSFISAIMVLGTPAEMYTQGTQMALKTIGYCAGLGLSSILMVPLFYGLKITSSFEYLERRYNSVAVKLMGSGMMILGNLMYMGLVIYTPSTALEAVTGIPFWMSVLASAFVATIYTAVGGMRAVVWTDVFQALVMFGGMLAILIQGTMKVGGLSKVWEISSQGGRLIWFDFNPDPTQRLSFWSLVVGGLFSGIGIFGIGQTSMQRYCALPTLSQAKRSLFLNIPGLIIVNVLAGLVGLVIYAYYAQAGCDPLKQKFISNQNQLVPYFVLDVLNYPGFPGVFLAVLFSGALSSVSSVLNSLAAVTWQDILKPCCLNLSERRKNIITKITVLGYGVLAVMVAFLTNGLGINVLQASLTFTGVTMGPGLGLFLVGGLFPFVNTAGAMTGCATSLGLSLWIIGGNFIYRPGKYTRLPTSSHNCSLNQTVLATPSTTFSPFAVSSPFMTSERLVYNTSSWLSDPDVEITQLTPSAVGAVSNISGIHKLYAISFLWYTALGAIVTIVVGVVASLILRQLRPQSAKYVSDPSLVLPLADYFCCCLPQRWRHKLTWSGHSSSKELQAYTLTAVQEEQVIEVSGDVKVQPHFHNTV